MDRKFALGIDYGTNSVRALIVDVANGDEIGSFVHNYTRGKDGVILNQWDSNVARQDPHDYVEGLEASVRGAIEDAEKKPGFSPDEIVGIGIDTTGSTPIPVDEEGVPLAFHEEFAGNPNALAWLWKDHTGHAEAELITSKAHEWSTDYTKYCGGCYSSEWFFSKIFHLANVDPKVYAAAASFVEHCDWMPALLIGDTRPNKIHRSRCAAGHKAMWNDKWRGLPSQEFWSSVSPKLDGLIEKLYQYTYTADTKVGKLCKEWAEKLGLPKGIAVAAGAFDAHTGAVGSGVKPGTLVKIMGTSTCDMMVASPSEVEGAIKGICGQVDGSIVPGMIGIEAGQSAVGDIFAWWRDQLMFPLSIFLGLPVPQEKTIWERSKISTLGRLTERAAKRLKPGSSGLMALDWWNGNRTILVDPNLTGMIVGLTLGTRQEDIFSALVESTAFGARVIMERIEEYGIEVCEVVTGGGIAERNPWLMQVYADVTGRPIKVSRSSQTCALGSAMFGAVAGGHFKNVEKAQEIMSGLKDIVYTPNPEAQKVYGKLYVLYRRLHDAFGTPDYSESLYGVMKELLDIKRAALKG